MTMVILDKGDKNEERKLSIYFKKFTPISDPAHPCVGPLWTQFAVRVYSNLGALESTRLRPHLSGAAVTQLLCSRKTGGRALALGVFRPHAAPRAISAMIVLPIQLGSACGVRPCRPFRCPAAAMDWLRSKPAPAH